MKEQQPKIEINNLTEFQVFFDTYVSSILANPPNKKPFPKNLPSDSFHSMLYTTEKNPFHDEFIKRRLRRVVFITEVVWDDLSESLQDLFSLQYDSATVNGHKRISLEIGKKGILFRLQSSHTYDFVDWLGEYYAPGIKFLAFKFPFDEELEGMTGGKKQNEGEFAITKSPLVRDIRRNSILEKSLMKGESLTKEEKDFLEKCMEEDRSGIFTQIIPSTLIHLHDIARLLSTQRLNAFIYSD